MKYRQGRRQPLPILTSEGLALGLKSSQHYKSRSRMGLLQSGGGATPMTGYFIADGTVQRGPFPIHQLPRHGLRADTLVWNEAMPQWQRADEVEELALAGVLALVPP